MRMLALTLFAIGLAVGFPGSSDTAQAADTDQAIRIATLAPRSSDLVRGFNKIDKGLRDNTGGQWGLKLYPSGIAGDEKDVLKKMKVGQMDGTVVTSVGLSQVDRELAVLTAPGAIEDYKQVERVQNHYNAEWEKKLEENGFKLTGWGEIGMLRFFTKIPLNSPADLKKTRPWVWPDSHTMKALWHAIGVTGVPLGVPEVYGALQTSMIDAVISTALAVAALQWHAKLDHVTADTHGPLVGGMVFSTQKWKAIPDDVRAKLEEQIQKNYKGDNIRVREDDVKAYKKLLSRGYTATPYSAQGKKDIEEYNKKARESLVGRVYSRELLDGVMKVARGG